MPSLCFDPVLQSRNLDRVGRRLFMNLDRDIHSVKHILFRPETRIQSVETTDGSLEQRFGFNLGGVFDSKIIDVLHDTLAIEH